MKTLLTAAALATFAMVGQSVAAETPRLSNVERAETRLAERLEGRTAGEPQSCITATRSNDIEVIDYVGVVYEQGDTIWVSRASDPRSLTWTDVPIFERQGSQLCKFDLTRTVDRSSHSFSGAVFLGDFVPYTKAG